MEGPSHDGDDSVQARGQASADSSGHFPHKPHDISRVRRWLQYASSHRLPDELLGPILFYADYDCIHLSASTSTTVRRSSRGAETPAEVYIETEPLRLPTDSQTPPGRIRSIRLQTTGKDQGWVSNPTSDCWSWFELGRRQSRESSVRRGPAWAWNAVAGREWQIHRLTCNVDDGEASAELVAWIHQLRDGDRVSIVPMARFGGWQCQAKEASIDIEVQLWR